MGYINSGTSLTLTAKLTPIGRQKLILTNNNLITSFSLGDSDANYYAALPLLTSQMPGNSGNIGPYGTFSNSVAPSVAIKSSLVLNNTGVTLKAVEPQSSGLTTNILSNGLVTLSASSLTQNTVNRNDINTDPLVNLYYSFNLPLNSSEDNYFTGVTYSNNGFSNTGFSGLAQSNIYVIGINNSLFGESLDGRAVKVQVTTTASTYTLYSTFQNNGQPLTVQDANYCDTSIEAKLFDTNPAIMFSDKILKPNGGNSSLSWATGFNTVKPFSQNGKQLYNLTTNTNLSQSADTAVGVAYLDKGFIVITNQQMINEGIISSSTTVTFNSISTSVVQNVTCIANRGEFGTSTNPTFAVSDTPRISEVGIYDTDNALIAIAKPDRHIVRNVNEFLALSIKITI
jgi:hypothetical protein